jgi:hypothetical protein
MSIHTNLQGSTSPQESYHSRRRENLKSHFSTFISPSVLKMFLQHSSNGNKAVKNKLERARNKPFVEYI